MSSISQKLKAVITFGGNIDGSWGRSTDGLNKGLKTVEKQSEHLAKQQKALADRMKQTKLAGKDVSALKRDYDTVTRSIKRTEQEQESLNRSLQRAERFRRAGAVGRGFIGRAGRTLGAGLGIAAAGGLIGAGIGAVMSPVRSNAETAESYGIARSYGVNIDTFNAWQSLSKQMGLNGENFGDLFEEYRNKVSDFKKDPTKGAIAENFPLLGFKAGDMYGKSNEDQVSSIFERLLKLDNEQLAAGYADSIFGGEANKILTYMRLTGKSYRDLMNEQKRYNLVTRDGAEGAMRSNIAFSNLRTVWSSAVDQIAGKLGGDLAPMVTKLADELSDWFKNGGIEVIASTIRNSWIPALIEFGNGLITFSKVAIRIAKWLGQFVPDENTDRRAIVHALASGDVDKARSVAKDKGESTWLESVISDPEKVGKLKDIYHDTQWSMSKNRFTNPWQYWTKAEDKMLSAVGGDKTAPDPVMSEFWKKLQSAAGSEKEKPNVTDNRRNNIYMTVNGSPGQDAKSIADNAVTQIGKLDVFNGNNAMYDAPGGWSG
ncbi:hypothetical protein FS595_10600 [Serratia rubidaea]|uniref:hypothetical protein n=1 Tax=Serratia rubidaea TaxID=61652 RepID=UPI001F381297|nr:hypothetical protein [Serratia rubidaea]UJD80122.1 hypothetical protein FS596_10600 [Serratia rubidaea]UJD84678.1 hypothetical protein FS595_10600 [Serratia rubidaea]